MKLQPRVDPSEYGETFAILVETFPFPGLLPPCPVNQPFEVDPVTDYTRVLYSESASRNVASAPRPLPLRCRNIPNTCPPSRAPIPWNCE